MKLYVESNLPKGTMCVKNHETWFIYTKLPISDYIDKLLEERLHVRRVSDELIMKTTKTKKIHIPMSKSILDINMKTLLNVYVRTDICFDISDCSDEYLYEIFLLDRGVCFIKEEKLLSLERTKECNVIFNDGICISIGNIVNKL